MNRYRAGVSQLLLMLFFLCTVVAFTNCDQASFHVDPNTPSGDRSSRTETADPTPSPGPGTSPTLGPGPSPTPNPSSDSYNPFNGPTAAGSRIVSVNSTTSLLTAIANAAPGDAITVEDGVYVINTDKVRFPKSGTSSAFVFLRARNPLMATLQICATAAEGFYMSGTKYWVFEGLKIDGSTCEATNDHAFHIVGSSSNIILRGNLVTNFRSPVKVNGEGSPRTYPSNLWFINNTWKMTKVMSERAVPHNVLNIDGGTGHIVRGNRFVDHLRINNSSSSVYLKMGTRDFLVEQNLVVCQKRLTPPAGTAFSPRGIFGGDANADPNPLCENEDCANYRGLYRNNIVMNCQGSGNVSGIQLRFERDTKYVHNTVHTVKNNFMFNESNPGFSLYSNIMESPLVYGGSVRPVAYHDNLEQGASGTSQIWVNAGLADFNLKDGTFIRQKAPRREDAIYDFCGHLRSSMTDLGAIDYSHPKVSDCLSRIREMYDSL